MTYLVQKRRTISIRGVLTLTAQTHQTSPEKKLGCTLQMKTRVIAYQGGVGTLIHAFPYVTNNSVRGMVRRAAGGILMQELKNSENQICKNMYLSIMRGSFARNGIEAGGGSYQQIVAAQDHMFAGLFGGGANMYSAKLRGESDLFPMLKCMESLFPDRYKEFCIDATPKDILGEILVASRDDFQKLPVLDVVKDMENAYEEHMASKFAISTAKRAQKADADASNTFVSSDEKIKSSDLNTYTLVETIIPGTPLFFGMTETSVTDAQIGLLLNAILAWCNRNVLGGGSVRGRGSFKASLQVYEGDSTLAENMLVGEAPNYRLSSELSEFTAAMNKELAQAALPKTLNSIYPIVIKDKDAKKEKKAKKGSVAESVE